MRLKTTMTLEFEGLSRDVLIAALTRGIAELRRGIEYGAMSNGTSGIKQRSVKINYTEPELC
jgi:hypothetical protein